MRSFYERLVSSLETWDRDGSETSMKLVALCLREAPALKTAHDAQTFYEYSALLTRLLVIEDVELRLSLNLLPIRLRPGFLARAARNLGGFAYRSRRVPGLPPEPCRACAVTSIAPTRVCAKFSCVNTSRASGHQPPSACGNVEIARPAPKWRIVAPTMS